MTVEQLAQRVANGQVEALDLVSVEGGSYTLHARAGAALERVLDGQGNTLHVASVEQARKVLAAVPDVPFFLVQAAVHEEMVGLGPASEPAREPLKLRSSL